jgi:hypothetical protein
MRSSRTASVQRDRDPQPCLMPPDWSGGYTSIFALQQKEERAAA